MNGGGAKQNKCSSAIPADSDVGYGGDDKGDDLDDGYDDDDDDSDSQCR